MFNYLFNYYKITNGEIVVHVSTEQNFIRGKYIAIVVTENFVLE